MKRFEKVISIMKIDYYPSLYRILLIRNGKEVELIGVCYWDAELYRLLEELMHKHFVSTEFIDALIEAINHR